MDTTLAIHGNHEMNLGPVNRSIPTEHEMMVFTTISKQAAESKLYKNLGDQPAIMMTILAARELGAPPMLALNGGINNIQGKLEISARLMNGLMRRAGIKISIKESTDEKCTLMGVRGDNGDSAIVSYTLADASKAGLIKPGGGWVKNPKDMCFARAISRLARQIAPDIIGGCYVEGEIRASEIDVVVPNDIPMEIPENPKESEENLLLLLEKFDKEDRFLLMEYIEVVMTHFKWSKNETVKKFLEEKELINKFNNWKIKQKIADQSANVE